MKKIFYIAFYFCSTLLFTSCIGDLDQYPHVDETSSSIYTSAENYKSVLGKIYTSMVTTGQEKNGNEDLSSNSGQDYMRCYFNLQECGTDEVASTWLSGDNVTGLTYLSWDANDPWVSDMYYRIYYNIALCNEFLRNATDDKIGSFSADDQKQIRTYRAEARFMRALFYYHALDLFRNVPFVTENDPLVGYLPPQYTPQQTFDYIESELKTITDTNNPDNCLLVNGNEMYGRATLGAAYTLLAKLYLNAKVYINQEKYTECITACKNVITQGYSLEPDYPKLFNADNHLRTNEIIFTLPIDAVNTVSWGSSTYIVCGAVSNTSELQKPEDYGVKSGWGMFRVRGNIPPKFEQGDQRYMFFTEGQSLNVDVIDDQTNGYFVTKWTNLTDAKQTASNTADGGVNTDYPLFRLADVYLMMAEAHLRGGTGATNSEVTGYVNLLRERAYGDNSGNKQDYEFDNQNQSKNKEYLQFILDERARELYWEGYRRTDLIRYGIFTNADYLWQWKGGVKEGTKVNDKFNIYPIPNTELTANPNLKNENY